MIYDPKKREMPTQAPEGRAHNFREVALGYTQEIAVEEAKRCLHCKNQPCVAGCPVNIHIPEFIEKVKTGGFADNGHGELFRGRYHVVSKVRLVDSYGYLVRLTGHLGDGVDDAAVVLAILMGGQDEQAV